MRDLGWQCRTAQYTIVHHAALYNTLLCTVKHCTILYSVVHNAVQCSAQYITVQCTMACRFLIAQLPDWDWGWSLFSPGVQTQWLHYCALHYCAIHFRFYFQRQPNQSVKTNYLIYSNFGLFLRHFLLLLSATSTASAPLRLLRLDNITRLSKSADYFPNSRVARIV